MTVAPRSVPAGMQAVHRVAVLVADGVGLVEFGQAGDAFRAATDAPGPARPRYEVIVCAAVPGQVRSREGHELSVPAGLDALTGARTLVLPGCRPIEAGHDPSVVAAVRAAHAGGARVVATCTGVSLAVAAGLLNGRGATTHWNQQAALTRAFPDVVLARDVLYVDHGDVITGAGTGAGLDVYLRLIRRDHGADVADHVARQLVAPLQQHRARARLRADRVQTQATPPRSDLLLVLLQHLAAHLHEREPIVAVAARWGMSERTLRRRFDRQLDTTPGRWLAAERLRQARSLLETTDMSVETIAHRTGLASATALRRQFRRELNITPSSYRTANRPQSLDRQPYELTGPRR